MLALTLLDISVRLDELRRPPDLPRPGVPATRLPLYRPPGVQFNRHLEIGIWCLNL